MVILELLAPLALRQEFSDREVVFQNGETADLFIVESGAVEVVNPADDDKSLATHPFRLVP